MLGKLGVRERKKMIELPRLETGMRKFTSDLLCIDAEQDGELEAIRPPDFCSPRGLGLWPTTFVGPFATTPTLTQRRFLGINRTWSKRESIDPNEPGADICLAAGSYLAFAEFQ